ncbi:MAG: AraC family transcriptional regulator ligand-binding domain-containing protein [Sandaracinaceae bacterium]|nr:AraC family transcriptional regulator ligand-binding domain-containing protein [Sandaracinaceae bacterium]
MGWVPTITGHVVRRVLEHAERAGVDSRRIAAEVGIRKAVLEDEESRVPVPQYFLLWSNLAPHVESPKFGLELGASIGTGDLGILGYLMASQRTVRDALERRYAMTRLLMDFGAERYEVDASEARMAYAVPLFLVPLRHVADYLSASVVGVMAEVTDGRIRPKRVALPHLGSRADVEAYAAHFGPGVEVRLGEPLVEIVYDAAALDEPLTTADTTLARYLGAQAEQMLEELPTTDDEVAPIRAAVSDAIRRGEVPTQGQIAKSLGLSVRTLQRRLAAVDSSFTLLLDEVRYAFAKLYLGRRELSNQEVAFMLGYAETSAFYRAFRRWAGVTPSAYRDLA